LDAAQRILYAERGEDMMHHEEPQLKRATRWTTMMANGIGV